MTTIKLEVGKTYFNGYGNPIKITEKIDYPEGCLFYDIDDNSYNDQGRVSWYRFDEEHPEHLIGEAITISKQLYDDLIKETSDTWLKKIARWSGSLCGYVVTLTMFAVVWYYVASYIQCKV